MYNFIDSNRIEEMWDLGRKIQYFRQTFLSYKHVALACKFKDAMYNSLQIFISYSAIWSFYVATY